MEKWADFIISRVRYDDDHSRIIECEVFPDFGEGLGAKTHHSRTTIASNLENNHYLTVYKNEKGNFIKGDNVIRYLLDGEYFIRTDGNKLKKDNLGKLPEY